MQNPGGQHPGRVLVRGIEHLPCVITLVGAQLVVHSQESCPLPPRNSHQMVGHIVPASEVIKTKHDLKWNG